MATKPAYIDYRAQIPHKHTETEQRRALSEVTHQIVHYLAGAPVNLNMTQAQEQALILSLAAFHQRTDFGGGSLGRTLEYTYAVAPSGRIYQVNDETLIVWSHRNGNRIGMSTVLLLGTGQNPTPAMLATLQQHFDWCAERADVGIIRARTFGHGECRQVHGGGPGWGNNTECPGAAIHWVREYRTASPLPPPPSDNTEFFTETGHNLSNAFRDYWHANGGLAVFGFPLTEEEAGSAWPWQMLPELAGYTCQRFERQSLHYKDGEGVGVVRTGALVEALMSGHGAAVDSPCNA